MNDRARFADRSAFTILEVMCALAVLCVGLSAVLSQYATVEMARYDTARTAKVQDVVRKLIERVAGAEPADMGLHCNLAKPWQPASVPSTRHPKPWFQARFFDDPADPLDDVANDRPPFSDGAAQDVDDLVKSGLVEVPTGIEDLKIYFEYYRGQRGLLNNGLQDVTEPGLIDGDSDDPDLDNDLYDGMGDFRKLFSSSDPLDKAFIRRMRFEPSGAGDIDLELLLAEDDPYVIRILATWDNGIRKMEAFTAKRRIR